MGKNIVICCDGTWNSPEQEEYGRAVPTNVYRLYRGCLDWLESGGTQTKWYYRGIGAEVSAVRQFTEGATGSGIANYILKAYTAISQEYTDPGDRIFLFGFSRGAFVARSVAGMISRCGLLRKEACGDLGIAWKHYLSGAWRKADQICRLSTTTIHDPESVRIHFIGVWDTVAALGIPMWGWSFTLPFVQSHRYHVTSPSESVDHVYHALSMDEVRSSFMPTLWESPQSGRWPPHIEQVWFRGVHSDIGGGYDERGLGDITLGWMIEKAIAAGLRVKKPLLLDALKPDPMGRIHDSYRGVFREVDSSWPRWFPCVDPTGKVTPGEFGTLHESVWKRVSAVQQSGEPETTIRFLKPGESKKVEIAANRRWVSTGVVMEAGGTYGVTAEGWWQKGTEIPVGPEGRTSRGLERLWKWGRQKPDANWLELIGLVNEPRRWPVREFGLLRWFSYMWFRDPKILLDSLEVVGKGPVKFAPQESGVFYCFANDWWDSYADNSGSVWVTIERSS